jgi:hypothetical protein
MNIATCSNLTSNTEGTELLLIAILFVAVMYLVILKVEAHYEKDVVKYSGEAPLTRNSYILMPLCLVLSTYLK